jgi:hypothetical protein
MKRLITFAVLCAALRAHGAWGVQGIDSKMEAGMNAALDVFVRRLGMSGELTLAKIQAGTNYFELSKEQFAIVGLSNDFDDLSSNDRSRYALALKNALNSINAGVTVSDWSDLKAIVRAVFAKRSSLNFSNLIAASSDLQGLKAPAAQAGPSLVGSGKALYINMDDGSYTSQAVVYYNSLHEYIHTLTNKHMYGWTNNTLGSGLDDKVKQFMDEGVTDMFAELLSCKLAKNRPNLVSIDPVPGVGLTLRNYEYPRRAAMYLAWKWGTEKSSSTHDGSKSTDGAKTLDGVKRVAKALFAGDFAVFNSHVAGTPTNLIGSGGAKHSSNSQYNTTTKVWAWDTINPVVLGIFKGWGYTDKTFFVSNRWVKNMEDGAELLGFAKPSSLASSKTDSSADAKFCKDFWGW